MKSGCLLVILLAAGCTFDSSQLQALGTDGAAGATADAEGVGGQGGVGGTGGQSATASPAPATCVPGASALCYCPTGQQGAQICTSAGTFGACACASPTVDAGGAGGSDGSATRLPDVPPATGGTTYTPTGGTISYSTGGTISHPTGGTTMSSPPSTGGTPSSTPTGTTVTFAAGKAQGAMVGYGWVALGSLDSITDPKCGTATITAAAPCTTSTTWDFGGMSTSALCVTGNVPALGTPPDDTNNWGLSVGVNASATAGTGLGQPFTSITITVTGLPSSGLRAMFHRSGDPDATSYCHALTSGIAIPFTSFSTTCYTTASPGTAITAADVPKIDKISVQVSSGTAAIPVSNLCITGITFTK